MLGCETILVDGFDMCGSSIADMAIKAVFWVFIGERNHILIAGDFGDNRGGGNGGDFSIGFNKSGGVIGEGSVGQKIDSAVDDDLREGRMK